MRGMLLSLRGMCAQVPVSWQPWVWRCPSLGPSQSCSTFHYSALPPTLWQPLSAATEVVTSRFKTLQHVHVQLPLPQDFIEDVSAATVTTDADVQGTRRLRSV